MNPQEIFGLIVRLLGLFVLFYSGWYLLFGICQLVGFEKDRTDMDTYLFMGFIAMIIAIYLLRGAPHLVRFSYPPTGDDRAEENV